MHLLRVWIFANGEIKNPAVLLPKIGAEDLVIAADGGYAHLRRMGILPGLLIGDLDSIDPDDLEVLKISGVPVRQHPAEKDETDLELAISSAVLAGAGQICIAGALGGRLDQMLANLFLLARADLVGMDVSLEDGETRVVLVRSAGQVEGSPGDTVSLIPLNGPAYGVRTAGLRYPLHGETLYPEMTRGISNILVGEQCQVSLESGLLVLVHIRKNNQG
jgi:thiamine pyrophosphokinase